VQRATIQNLSILVGALLFCAFVLESMSRLFFDAPPSVAIENLPANEDQIRSWNRSFRVEDGKVISDGIPDWGFYLSTPTGMRLKRSVKGMVENNWLSKRDVIFETNSLGFRSAEVGEKQPDEFRVLALGDSITLAASVNVEETYPGQAETFLRTAEHPALEGREVRVINAGIGAIDLENEFAILMDTGLLVEPDIVLVGLYLNDAYHSSVLKITKLPAWLGKSHFVRLLFWHLDTVRKRHLYQDPERDNRKELEREREHFLANHPAEEAPNWQKSREGFHRMIAIRFEDWGYAWSENYWRRTMPTLELMKQVANENGAELAVLFFPVRHQVQSDILMDEPQQRFEREMTARGIPHFDLLPPLRERFQRDGEDLFHDQCHYRAEGYAFVGQLVGDFLLREVVAQ
jgi:hypothetical protein